MIRGIRSQRSSDQARPPNALARSEALPQVANGRRWLPLTNAHTSNRTAIWRVRAGWRVSRANVGFAIDCKSGAG
jgi:hypothetical protein